MADAHSSSSHSFDHFIGAREEIRRDREPQRLGRLEVDHQLEFGRLLDRKIGRLRPLKDHIHVPRGAPVEIGTDYVIGYQATSIADLYRIRVHGRQSMAGGELTHSGAASNEDALGRYDEPLGALTDGGLERAR